MRFRWHASTSRIRPLEAPESKSLRDRRRPREASFERREMSDVSLSYMPTLADRIRATWDNRASDPNYMKIRQPGEAAKETKELQLIGRLCGDFTLPIELINDHSDFFFDLLCDLRHQRILIRTGASGSFQQLLILLVRQIVHE